MTVGAPYIALLQEYETRSNRHDVDGCVAMFLEQGRIETNGEVYEGPKALRDAHEYDLGSRTQVAFRDFVVEGNTVHCTFWNEHELGRLLESGGLTGKAIFTFEGDKIQSFAILPPAEEEQRRVMTIVRPAFIWLRENHPDVVARWNGFDRAAGEAVFAMAELWREHLRATQS
jgi:hypothetical protein